MSEPINERSRTPRSRPKTRAGLLAYVAITSGLAVIGASIRLDMFLPLWLAILLPSTFGLGFSGVLWVVNRRYHSRSNG